MRDQFRKLVNKFKESEYLSAFRKTFFDSFTDDDS